MPSLLQEMDPHGEKLGGDGYHANGQSDSEAWSEPLTETAEPRRPRLSFSNTYVEMQCTPHKHICMYSYVRNALDSCLGNSHISFVRKQQVSPLYTGGFLIIPLYKCNVHCFFIILYHRTI